MSYSPIRITHAAEVAFAGTVAKANVRVMVQVIRTTHDAAPCTTMLGTLLASRCGCYLRCLHLGADAGRCKSNGLQGRAANYCTTCFSGFKHKSEIFS